MGLGQYIERFSSIHVWVLVLTRLTCMNHASRQTVQTEVVILLVRKLPQISAVLAVTVECDDGNGDGKVIQSGVRGGAWNGISSPRTDGGGVV